MAEYKPPYSRREAVIEANRCLFCFDAPCISACPTGIDVPAFIGKIAHRNPIAAARTILRANILGSSCAQACPTDVLCEGACVVLSREGDPVKIGRLQRFATDAAYESGAEVLPQPREKTGRRIVVIGSGPAGLGCASELAILGHEVTILEKQDQPGGLNTYGIAYYKMKPSVSLKEIRLIESLGVEIQCGVEVGRDISTDKMMRDYNAVFIGIGLGNCPPMRVPGEELPEVIDALDFIAQIHTTPLHKVPVGNEVAVIGGGNTAIDAITQAKRLGAARATIIYRRDAESMPAYNFEYELAKMDRGDFLFNTVVKTVKSDSSGHVSGLILMKSETDPQGRISTIEGSEFEFPCDMVLKAIGSEKRVELLRTLFPSIEINSGGSVACDAESGQASLAKVFSGGDCANGGREVVNAVAEGKRAAFGIHAFLTGEQIEPPMQPSRYGVAGTPNGSGFHEPVRVAER
jgi:glutamate synthase (NADPH/NADH) small chain